MIVERSLQEPVLVVIKLEFILKHKLMRNDWLLADTCGHVSASNQSLRFILSLRLNSSFITSRADCTVVHWMRLNILSQLSMDMSNSMH